MTVTQAPESAADTVLLAGLPSAGKTSYLAAAWHALRQTKHTTELTLNRLPPSAEFLNQITEQWLGCVQADHTSASSTSAVVLELRRGSGPPGELVIPDYSGEFVRDAWVDRRWPAHMDQYVRDARAVLLAVHPTILTGHTTVEEYARNAATLEAGPPDVDRKPEPFDRSKVPSQTMLVEFLQFARSRAKARVLPVGILISAWDLIRDEGLTPPEILRSYFPLLQQYLVANSSEMPSTVFGVSAQGGDWATHRDVSLAARPEKRAFLIDASGKELRDLTIPMAWAMTVL
jgi:hypothetical protein